MSERPNHEESSLSKAEKPAGGLVGRARGLVRKFWYVPVILGIILLQVGTIGVYRWLTPAQKTDASHEVSLGTFGFETTSTSRSMVSKAEFTLHISLIPELDRTGRQLLKQHQFLLQQNVEELLRQAAPADFEDPSLAELKRQIQATVNQTVGRRIVADVIITDLDLHRSGPPEVQTVDADPSSHPEAPWREAAPAS